MTLVTFQRSFPLAMMMTLIAIVTLSAEDTPQPFRIPRVNLAQQIIWDSTCKGENEFLLGFGGQDQIADETSRTRVQVEGVWQSLSDELRRNNPLQNQHEVGMDLVKQVRQVAALRRAGFFSGRIDKSRLDELIAQLRKFAADCDSLTHGLGEQQDSLADYSQGQSKYAVAILRQTSVLAKQLLSREAHEQISSEASAFDTRILRAVEQAAEALDSEPPPRYLSPLVYDSRSNRFVLFGGDHGDYLTNDLWLFDPARKAWEQRHPVAAPAPRGGHHLSCQGDGKVNLVGGYRYMSSMSYCGEQYAQISDGEWTYDIAANAWTGKGELVSPATRVYRTDEFDPAFYMQGPTPDPVATENERSDIPANFWVPQPPPQQPQMVRTWGHAVLDPNHDQILVFGGGHSAHGGSDVLHYHLATNRWELPFPVEFPLGQTYSNTEYPEGFNLNRRPWVTGHTYQGYHFDPRSKRMYFVGRARNTYVYDPAMGDWTGRIPKPEAMVYGDCFYTLPLVSTPRGLVCWTGRGDIFRLDTARQQWQQVQISGAALPVAEVDSSTFVYDSKRDRLLIFRAEYDRKYEGQVHALDLQTGTAEMLSPPNAKALAALGMKEISRAVYDPQHDLVLFASLLPGEISNIPPTLAYDCATNQWVSLKIGYNVNDDGTPVHPYGPGHSCGLMYDAARRLLWGIDTHKLRVFALRLEPKDAVLKVLE